ncbi:alpha/beta hydrolase [Chloroflexus islandicus]|uniref:Alpha/beta hydrolase n=1 Tax=Chloroflexus islandicus TaxID=1707952 RepID=A0A178M540_9CHLR|nr:alpha/beta hydrolase [Chloroflexus islandicus]OAN43879.1 alpha/beta hydrolase [Chloroflexus islandicus]
MLGQLFTPLSTAAVPLIYGLSHRALLRLGATSHERRLAGIRAHYYAMPARGEGNLPVLLLHGIADRAQTWSFVMPKLTTIGPVYALDLAGFGLSGFPPGQRYATIEQQTALVQAMIREVIGRPTLIVGNSMGGWIAVRVALATPELVAGIVLLAPGGAILRGRESWEPFLHTIELPDGRTVRKVLRQMYGRPPLPLYFAGEGLRSIFRRDPVTQFVAALDEHALLRPEDLRALRVPVAMIWGEDDYFIPRESRDFFCANLPHARVIFLPRCGHMPQQQRPREVAAFIREFARELAAASNPQRTSGHETATPNRSAT